MRRPASGAVRVPRAAVVTASVTIVLIVVHMFFTAVYNVPWSSVKYGALPGAASDSYIRPYLVQDYRIFAPNPAHTDNQLWVRAWVEKPDGERVESEWVNATAVELAAPYRKVLRKQLTIVGAERTMSSYEDLTAPQRVVAAQNFHRDGDLTGLRDALAEADASNPGAVTAFIRATNYITSYATQAAYALWGDDGDVLAVQTRVVFDPVIRWNDRFDEEATRPSAGFTDLGWRPLLEWRGQDRDAFAATFVRWADQAGISGDLGTGGTSPGDTAGTGGTDGGAGGDE